MKTKDQLNQNPGEEIMPNQEENSESVEKTDIKTTKDKQKPVEDQGENSNEKKPAKKKAAVKPKKAGKSSKEKRTPKNAVEPEKEAVSASEEEDSAGDGFTSVSGDQPDYHEETLISSATIPTAAESADMNEETAGDTSEPTVKSTKSPVQTLEAIVEHDDHAEDEESDDHDDEHENAEEMDYAALSREELVRLLEETVAENDVTKIRKKVALIKVAFMKINKKEQDLKYEAFTGEEGDDSIAETTQDIFETRFNEAFSVYRQKRKLYLDELEKEKLTNLEAKKIILEELKALIDSEESLKKTYDDFKELQERWKEIGMVPKNEVNNLWQSYHFYVEKFFDKVKINRELRDLDLKKNLEAKIELCEKTEELLLETSIMKSFKQLQKYHQQWKEIGPIPQDKKEEIWERFKNATDKINERRREHYEKLQENQNNNYIAKTALCEKAEEILQVDIKSIKEWQEYTDNITQLLKVWKTIGPAPRKKNDEIWDRFKTSLDSFFASKTEFFQEIKAEQLNNYNLKLNICAQAEAIKNSTDWKNTSQELIKLQKEWKTIGPVPRKYSDKIWKRFRAACDEFFKHKSEFYANIGQHEAENLKLKEELIAKVEAYGFGDNKNGNLDILKEFQREWTEIGHVPMKEKDRIQKKFRNAINMQLDKLNISKAEMRTINYKNRIESLKDNPNARKIIYNEKNQLIGKRKKMEEEINLWENNIGFLAASKKASLLKDEFEKKIENAKKEIEVLNEKIKFLEREA